MLYACHEPPKPGNAARPEKASFLKKRSKKLLFLGDLVFGPANASRSSAAKGGDPRLWARNDLGDDSAESLRQAFLDLPRHRTPRRRPHRRNLWPRPRNLPRLPHQPQRRGTHPSPPWKSFPSSDLRAWLAHEAKRATATPPAPKNSRPSAASSAICAKTTASRTPPSPCSAARAPKNRIPRALTAVDAIKIAKEIGEQTDTARSCRPATLPDVPALRRRPAHQRSLVLEHPRHPRRRRRFARHRQRQQTAHRPAAARHPHRAGHLAETPPQPVPRRPHLPRRPRRPPERRRRPKKPYATSAASTAYPNTPPPTPCATPLPRICYPTARIYARSRNCWGMSACRRPSATPKSTPSS